MRANAKHIERNTKILNVLVNYLPHTFPLPLLGSYNPAFGNDWISKSILKL